MLVKLQMLYQIMHIFYVKKSILINYSYYNYPCGDDVYECGVDKVHCLDGSCVSNVTYCPTVSVCGLEEPYLCPDNTCTSNPYKCPKQSYCGNNMIICPDGTCAHSITDCGTPLTCPESRPIRCYNNMCKETIEDCNNIVCEPPTPFMCYDGRCAENRMGCELISKCPDEYNVCLEGICVNVDGEEIEYSNVTCIKPYECDEELVYIYIISICVKMVIVYKV